MKKGKQLKVYGGTFDGRNRYIGAFPSHNQFLDALAIDIGCSKSFARQYSCETGNKTEVENALKKPGEIMLSKLL